MKVTMVVRNSIWYDPRVRRAAETALDKGIDVTAVGLMDENFNPGRISALSFKTVVVEADLSLQRGDISVFNKIRREYDSYSNMIKECIKTEPDVIHANDLDALLVGYIAAKRTGAGVIYDAHEIFCENTYIKSSRFKHYLWKTIESFLIKRVDAVVSVSYAAAGKLAEIYNIKEPTVVTNAARRIDPGQLMAKAADKYEILLHGKFNVGRGYETMIRAAPLLAECPDIKLVIRGYGPTEEALHNLAQQLKVGDNLVFDPPVQVNEMVPYAARSHVGIAITEPININYTFTVSNKIFEYITAGLPVIMSDVPEHRFLNAKYNFGIILEENTPQCLAKAVLALHNDTALYASLAQNAKMTAQELNWENEFNKMINLYRQVDKCQYAQEEGESLRC